MEICSGKAFGSAASLKASTRQQAGGLMIAVPVARAAMKSRDDHVGADFANRAHDVGQRDVFAPMLQGLVQTFGKAEVGDAGEQLLVQSVITARRQQLFRAQNSERVVKLRPDQIRASFAAVEREQRGVGALIAGAARSVARRLHRRGARWCAKPSRSCAGAAERAKPPPRLCFRPAPGPGRAKRLRGACDRKADYQREERGFFHGFSIGGVTEIFDLRIREVLDQYMGQTG